jgi:hypothetical protein
VGFLVGDGLLGFGIGLALDADDGSEDGGLTLIRQRQLFSLVLDEVVEEWGYIRRCGFWRGSSRPSCFGF